MATGAKFGGHVAVRQIAQESLGKAEAPSKTLRYQGPLLWMFPATLS